MLVMFTTYLIDDVYKLVSKLDGFVVAKYVSDGQEHLVIMHKTYTQSPPLWFDFTV